MRPILRREGGQATVEFAMVLPIVLLVIVGGIQFGLAFSYWLDLNHVASESARWTSVNRLPTGSINAPFDTTVSSDDVRAFVEGQVLSQGLRDSIDDSNEVQLVTIVATGGVFRLSFQSQQTAAIAFNAPGATVQANLQSLSTVGAGNVAVSGPAGGPYRVTFQGTLDDQDVPMLAINGTTLTNSSGPATALVQSDDGIRVCFEKGAGNTLATPQPGDALRIVVSAPYTLGFGLAEWALDPLTLRGKSTMRIEQAPAGFTASDAC